MRSPRALPYPQLVVACAAVVVGALWRAPPLCAQPTAPVRLRFEARGDLSGCPDERRLRDEVKERLGYDPFAAEAQRELWLRVESSAADVVTARIALSRRGVPAGTRELTSSRERCEELFEAVALSLSIAVDPLYGLRPSTPSSPATSSPPSPPDGYRAERVIVGAAPTPDVRGRRRVSASEWQPPPTPLLDDNSRLVFEVGGGVVAGLGAGPGSVLAASASVGARSGLLSLHLEAFAEAPGEVAVAEDAHVSGGVYGVSFQPCVRLWAGHLLMGRAAWAGGCGVVSAGGLIAGSEGLDDAQLAIAPWLGVGGRLTLDVALLHWLSLRLVGDAVTPLTRIRLTDRTSGASLWASPMASLRGGLQLVVFFP